VHQIGQGGSVEGEPLSLANIYRVVVLPAI